MNNNFLKKTRNEILREEVSTFNKTNKNLVNDFLHIIKNELDSINTENMFDNFVELIDTIIFDITKKFENSKYVSKIRDIFEKHFETIRQYFINYLNQTDQIKTTLFEHISKGISALQLKSKTSKHIIFDKDFVNHINFLSTSIKELIRNLKSNLKSVSNSNDIMNEHTSSLKSQITNLHISLTSTLLTKSNSQKQLIFPKQIKDDLAASLVNVESISYQKSIMDKNLNFIESYYSKFYDDAKITFKKLKDLHNDKLAEVSDTSYYEERKTFSRSVDPSKKKQNSSEQSRVNISNNLSLIDTSFIKKDNEKLYELNLKNKELLEEISKINEKYLSLKNDVEKIHITNNTVYYNCTNCYKISELVVNFIKNMNNLQDAINKKQSDVKELKQGFERIKKEIYHLASENMKCEKGDILISVEIENIKNERDNLINELNDLKDKLQANNILNKKFEEENKKFSNDIANLNIINEELNAELIKIKKELSNIDKEEFTKLKALNINLENLVKNLGEDMEKKNHIIHQLNKKLNEVENKKSDEISKSYDKLREEYRSIFKKNEIYERLLNCIEKQINNIECYKDVFDEFNILNNDDTDVKVEKITNGFLQLLSKLNYALEKASNELIEYKKKLNKENGQSNEIERLKRENEKITILENEIKLLKESKEKELNDYIHKNSFTSEKYDKEINEYKKIITSFENKLKEYESEKDIMKTKQIDDLLEMRVKINELEEKNKELNELINVFRNKEIDILKFKDDNKKEMDIRNYESLIKELEKKLKFSQDKINELHSSTKTLEIENNTVKSKNQDLINDIIKLNNINKNYLQRLNNLESELKVLEESLSSANKINTTNATAANEKYIEYENKIEKLENIIKITEDDYKTKYLNIDTINEKYEKERKSLKDIIINLEEKLKETEEKIKIHDDYVNKYETQINDVKKISFEKEENLSSKIVELENIIIELKNQQEINKSNNKRHVDDKLKSLNLQLTNKINNITAENTNLKDDIERLENNFSIVVTHINTFFENMVKAIYQLKSETNIVFQPEIESRIIDYENREADDHYNIENLEKDLEYTFLIVTEVFTQYQSATDVKQYQSLLIKKENKLLRYKEEIKKLKVLFDECTQTIYEAIKSTGYIEEDLSFILGNYNTESIDSSSIVHNNSERDFIHKAVEMFKNYNAEVNEQNKNLEIKLSEAVANSNKYKQLFEEYKTCNPTTNKNSPVRHFTVEDLVNNSMIDNDEYILDYSFIIKNPEKYKSVYETNYNDLIWYLLVEKNVNKNSYCYRNLIWVPSENLPIFEKESDYKSNRKEIEELLKINSELLIKIGIMEKEIVDSKEDNENYIPKDKYNYILKVLNEEQARYDELSKLYDELKIEFSNYKYNEVDVLQTLENFNTNKSAPLIKKSSNDSQTMKSINSCYSNKIVNSNVEKAISHIEESEKLLIEQLKDIKEELKITRNQRDDFKNKYNEAVTLFDGKNSEVLSMIKNAIEKLVFEIQITPKVKELLIVIMKGLNFNDEHINNVFCNKEPKKKGFLNIFK